MFRETDILRWQKRQQNFTGGGWHRGYCPAADIVSQLGNFAGVLDREEYYNGDYETEWDFLKDVLIKNGVPEKAILREDQATFTYENAIYSRQVTDREHLDIKKAILCCKSCHARRALMYYKLLYPDTEIFCYSMLCGFNK